MRLITAPVPLLEFYEMQTGEVLLEGLTDQRGSIHPSPFRRGVSGFQELCIQHNLYGLHCGLHSTVYPTALEVDFAGQRLAFRPHLLLCRQDRSGSGISEHAPSVDDAILRNIDDFDKLGAGQFQAPSRCCILRIAGNPKALKLQMGISSASAREA